MNNDVKITMICGCIIFTMGLGVFIGFVYYATYDEETIKGLQSMESIQRTVDISLVLFGAGLMIYQGNVFLHEALKIQEKQS